MGNLFYFICKSFCVGLLSVFLFVGMSYANNKMQSIGYATIQICESELYENNINFSAYERSNCFEESGKFYYYICDKSSKCEAKNMDIINTSRQDVIYIKNPYTGALTSPVRTKLDNIISKIRKKRGTLSLQEYNLLLQKFEAQLNKLGTKYSGNKEINNIIGYLQFEIKHSYGDEESNEVDNFLCDLTGSCARDGVNILVKESGSILEYGKHQSISSNLQISKGSFDKIEVANMNGVGARTKLLLDGNQDIYIAEFLTGGNEESSGMINVFETVGTEQMTRKTWISHLPGGSPISKRCSSSGNFNIIRWKQDSNYIYCGLRINTRYYLNIKYVSGCPSDEKCALYRTIPMNNVDHTKETDTKIMLDSTGDENKKNVLNKDFGEFQKTDIPVSSNITHTQSKGFLRENGDSVLFTISGFDRTNGQVCQAVLAHPNVPAAVNPNLCNNADAFKDLSGLGKGWSYANNKWNINIKSNPNMLPAGVKVQLYMRNKNTGVITAGKILTIIGGTTGDNEASTKYGTCSNEGETIVQYYRNQNTCYWANFDCRNGKNEWGLQFSPTPPKPTDQQFYKDYNSCMQR